MNHTPEPVVLAHAHTTGLPPPKASEDPKHGPSIGRSTLINLLGLLVPTVVGLATVPLYLHQIGEIRYGVLLLAFTFLGYFGAFDLGLGRAVAQRVARQDNVQDRNHTFWTAFLLSIGMGIIGAILLYFLGQWLFAAIFRIPVELRPEMENAVPWLAAIVPLTAVISVLAGALEARQSFVALNLSQMTGVIGLQILPLAAAMLGHSSMPVLLAAALAGRLLGVAVMIATTARALPFYGLPHIHRPEIGPLLRFGGWVSVSGLVTPLLTIVDRFFIGTMLGAVAVTAYTVPYNLTQRFTYLPAALSTALFPRFARGGNSENAQQILNDGIRGLVAIQTPFIVLGILLIYPFFNLWIGSDLTRRAAPVAIVLLVGIWINGPAYLPHNWMPAQGRPDLMARFYLAELLPFLALLWWLVDLWGIMGAALAWVIRSTADAAFCFVATGTTRTYGIASGITLLPVAIATIMALTQNPLFVYIPGGLITLLVAIALSFFLLPKPIKHRIHAWRHRSAKPVWEP
ncbi:flippase [Acidithiobacillus ferriphilus]|uniref:flippase n=2 Tax=Acidithiobacillus ferriphilus TaxID=1689834 RepID=UPI001D0325C7|nr:flippase [Acidithiobacillus ferriphilus]